MNKLSLSLTLSAVLISSMLWTTFALAHSSGMANEDYVGDRRDHLLVPRSGGCVRTGTWAGAGSGCSKQQTYVLEASALFDFDQATIKAAGRRQLNALANSIMAAGGIEGIDISGHTDSMGSDTYNQGLSMRRANAVKSYLVGKGVKSGMISTSGMGESRPAASNDTAQGRAMNRRVEVTLDRGE